MLKRIRSGRRIMMLLAMTIVLSLVAACGTKPAATPSPSSPAPAPAPKQPITVVAAVAPDWKTMDPGNSYEQFGQLALKAMYETVVNVNPKDGAIVPSLAEKWTVTPDGLTYTFTLRKDVKFSSGNPMTSADVAFSWMRLKNLKGNPAFLAANIKSVATPDPSTVVLTLNSPEGAILSKLGVGVFGITDSVVVKQNGGVDTENAKEVDKAVDFLNKNSAGSGPFVLKKFALKDETIMEVNPTYWGPAPKIDRLIFKEVADSNVQAQLLIKGDVDIAFNLTADQKAQVEAASGVKVTTGLTMNMFFLLMNHDPAIGGPFANEKVRQAVRAALDYDGFKQLFGLGAVTPKSIIQTGFASALLHDRKTDIDRAKKLLTEAGYPNGFDAKLEVSTFTAAGVNFVTAAQKVQQDLAKAGIRITLVPAELAVGLPLYREGKQAFSLWTWGPDYNDPANQLAFLPGDKVGLRANWPATADPALVTLGKQAMSESDQTKRVAQLQEIQRKMADYGPFATFLQAGRIIALRNNVEIVYHPVYLMDPTKLVKN